MEVPHSHARSDPATWSKDRLLIHLRVMHGRYDSLASKNVTQLTRIHRESGAPRLRPDH